MKIDWTDVTTVDHANNDYLTALVQLADDPHKGPHWTSLIARDLTGFRGVSPYGNSTPYPVEWAVVRGAELGPVADIAEAIVEQGYGPACMFFDDEWTLRIDFESDEDAVHFALLYL